MYSVGGSKSTAQGQFEKGQLGNGGARCLPLSGVCQVNADTTLLKSILSFRAQERTRSNANLYCSQRFSFGVKNKSPSIPDDFWLLNGGKSG